MKTVFLINKKEVIITGQNDTQTFLIEVESGEKKIMITEFVILFDSIDDVEEYKELRQEAKETEQNERAAELKIEMDELEASVQATIDANGGYTQSELMIQRLKMNL